MNDTEVKRKICEIIEKHTCLDYDDHQGIRKDLIELIQEVKLTSYNKGVNMTKTAVMTAISYL